MDEKHILTYNLSLKKCYLGSDSSKPNSKPKNNTFQYHLSTLGTASNKHPEECKIVIGHYRKQMVITVLVHNHRIWTIKG